MNEAGVIFKFSKSKSTCRQQLKSVDIAEVDSTFHDGVLTLSDIKLNKTAFQFVGKEANFNNELATLLVLFHCYQWSLIEPGLVIRNLKTDRADYFTLGDDRKITKKGRTVASWLLTG